MTEKNTNDLKDPKVTVKAAVIPKPQQAKKTQPKDSAEAAAPKPAAKGKSRIVGTVVPNKNLEGRTSRIPKGLVPVSKDVTDKALEAQRAEQAKEEEAVKKAAEEKAAEEKAAREAEARAKAEAEAEARAKEEAEMKAKAEADAEAARKAEEEAKAKEEALKAQEASKEAKEEKPETPAEPAKEKPKKAKSKAVKETAEVVKETAEKAATEVKTEAPAPKKPEPEKPKKKEFVGPKIIKTAAEVKAEEEALAEKMRKREEERKAQRNVEKNARKPQDGGNSKKRPQQKDGSGKGSDNRGQNKDREQNDRRQPQDKKPRVRDFSVQANQSQKYSGKPDKKRGEKEHDKFSKLEEGGKKSRKGMEFRSLEKAEKPKKHSQYRQQVQEEEPDIMEDLPTGTIAVTVPITVGGFCEQADISLNTVIMALMKMGIMANINQNLDEDTVMILADELGINVVVAKVEEENPEEGIEDFEDKEEDLVPRAPFVTVMGHVDHGKTSLLDAIRKTNVAIGEAGGITQHIGASEVYSNGQKIVFLDTPGHEAFTAMRARGAHVTDIAVLVVAADDGVMPQTIESISHAKAAGVPIIVAINKMDKPGANPDRVKQELSEHGILVEEWGGDTICCPVSAKKGDGIENLLEMILLQAEVLELKANPNRLAKGSVVEARLDKTRGPVATLLVDNGTLKAGQSVVVGNCYGKIRLMTDYRGKKISKAGPATAVEILGLDDVPEAGDEFNVVKDDKTAREIAQNRKEKLREEILARNASSTLEQLFSQIQEGEVKDLNLIIKADVAGSVEAIVSSLEKLNTENVRVKVVHTGVGTINESDVMLASTTGSIIIGFNVRPTTAVTSFADSENVQIRLYRVIYDIINEIQDAMKGMLDPEFKEEVLGKVEVRATFKVPNVGTIAGAYVTEGKVLRNAEVRLVRDGIVIHEGKISSLKRFKDDAKEVAQGYECGVGIENYNDIKEGDIIECFRMVEVERA